MMPEFRFAERKDCALILQFIADLAEYEKMADQVEELNALYARMIEAMTTNMNRPQI